MSVDVDCRFKGVGQRLLTIMELWGTKKKIYQGFDTQDKTQKEQFILFDFLFVGLFLQLEKYQTSPDWYTKLS